MPILVRDLPDDIAVLKRMVMEREESLAVHIVELGDAKAEIEHLKLQIAKLRRQQFGRSSEKLEAEIAQLELALDGLETDQAERQARRESKAGAEPHPGPQPEKRKPVRKPLPAHLPRKTIMHEGPCACSNCGGTLSKVGEDETEMLEVEKIYTVIRHVRPRMSCRKCETFTQPPLPEFPITRGMAGPGLLAHVLISKYCDHLPLYRQEQIFLTRHRVRLPRQTMAQWMGLAADWLRPIYEHIRTGIYTLDLWPALEHFLTDGRIEIDNNGVENAIRPTALGKKNWLFIGAAHAGERGAILYTIVESCRRRGIDPQAYLRDALTRLPKMTTSQIPEVTPEAWSKAPRQGHAPQAAA